MVGDIRQGEVVAEQRHEEDRGRDRGRAEGRDQCVLSRLCEPQAPLVRGERAGEDGVERQPETDDERGATQLGHYFAGEYFEGHLVTSEFRSPTKTPFRRRPCR